MVHRGPIEARVDRVSCQVLYVSYDHLVGQVRVDAHRAEVQSEKGKPGVDRDVRDREFGVIRTGDPIVLYLGGRLGLHVFTEPEDDLFTVPAEGVDEPGSFVDDNFVGVVRIDWDVG